MSILANKKSTQGNKCEASRQCWYSSSLVVASFLLHFHEQTRKISNWSFVHSTLEHMLSLFEPSCSNLEKEQIMRGGFSTQVSFHLYILLLLVQVLTTIKSKYEMNSAFGLQVWFQPFWRSETVRRRDFVRVIVRWLKVKVRTQIKDKTIHIFNSSQNYTLLTLCTFLFF